MKISFENLGAIKKIDLDLSKKLTLLCGPNGTGKTYVSYAVYGYLSTALPTEIFNFVELLEKKELIVQLDYDKLFYLQQEYIHLVKKNINNIFGLGNISLFDNFELKDGQTLDSFSGYIRGVKFGFNFKMTLDSTSVTFDKEADSDVLKIRIDQGGNMEDISLEGVVLNSVLGKYICNSSLLKTYILPVERNSAYMFGNNLAMAQFDSPSRNQLYPKAVREILKSVITLNDIKQRKSQFALLADDIEQTILKGKMIISEEGELVFFPSGTNIELPIDLAASSVKNLSALLLFIRYQAEKNSLLIIDEPELGLHPDNQVRLARIFARIINAGIRLMISTHSDYIIRELNNLVMLSSDNEAVKKVAKELGYKDDECIKKEDLGAYLFHFNTKDTSIVDVDMLEVTDSGVEIETIDEEICLLNQRTDDLFYALKYGEDIE